jgi:hypothetical protein
VTPPRARLVENASDASPYSNSAAFVPPFRTEARSAADCAYVAGVSPNELSTRRVSIVKPAGAFSNESYMPYASHGPFPVAASACSVRAVLTKCSVSGPIASEWFAPLPAREVSCSESTM